MLKFYIVIITKFDIIRIIKFIMLEVIMESYSVLTVVYKSNKEELYSAIRKDDNRQVLLRKTMQVLNSNIKNKRSDKNLHSNLRDLMIKGYKFYEKDGYFYEELEQFEGSPIYCIIRDKIININVFVDISIKLCSYVLELNKRGVMKNNINVYNTFISYNLKKIKSSDFSEVSLFRNKSFKDITDLGMILYEMVTGRQLSYNENNTLIKPSMNSRFKIPKVIDDIIISLIKGKCDYDELIHIKNAFYKCKWELNEYGKINNFSLIDVKNKKSYMARKCNVNVFKESYENFLNGSRSIITFYGEDGAGKTSVLKHLYEKYYSKYGVCIIDDFEKDTNGFLSGPILRTTQKLIDYVLYSKETSGDNIKKALNLYFSEENDYISTYIPKVKFLAKDIISLEYDEVCAVNETFNLLNAFAKEIPVVFFFDNVHKANYAQLYFMKKLMGCKEVKNILLVCTHNWCPLDINSPYSIILDELKDEGCSIINSRISPFTYEETEKFLKIILGNSEGSKELTKSIHWKTGGNPAYILELIDKLNDEGLIIYKENKKYDVDIDRLKSLEITKNVAELMVHRLIYLSRKTLEVLTYCSCIGSVFNINILKNIYDGSEDIYKNISKALIVGIIQNRGEVYFFSNELVLDNLYKRIPLSKRAEIHYKIEKYLENFFDKDDMYYAFAAIQCNKSLLYVENTELSVKVLYLNIRAAEVTLYKDDAKCNAFLKEALKLMGKRPFDKSYDEALKLYKLIIKYLIKNKRYFEAYEYINKAIKNIKNKEENFDLYIAKLKVCEINGMFHEIIEDGREALELLCIKMPDSEYKLKIEAKNLACNVYEFYTETKGSFPKVKKISKEDFNKLCILLKIIYTAASRLGYKELMNYARNYAAYSFFCANEPLEYKYIFIITSIMVIETKGDYKLAKELSTKALSNLYKEKDNEIFYKTFYYYGAFLNHYFLNVRSSKVYLKIAKEKVPESNVIMALIAFLTGEKIHSILFKVSIIMEENKDNKEVYELISLIYGALSYVQNVNHNSFDCEVFKESSLSSKSKDPLLISYFYLLKLIILYIENKYKEALKYYYLFKSVHSCIDNNYFKVMGKAFGILSMTACARHYKNMKYIEDAELELKSMKKLFRRDNINLSPMFYLIDAEICSLSKDYLKASSLYDEAIDEANNAGFISIAAIAAERAAIFYKESKKSRFVDVYVKESCINFEKWGIEKKICKFAQCNDNFRYNLDEDVEGKLKPSVIKSISKLFEDDREETILKDLSNILMQSLNPDRGSIVILKPHYSIYKLNDMNISKSSDENLPYSVLNYVLNTKEAAIFNDVYKSRIFIRDSYIEKNEPGCIMACPIIHKKEIIGVCILEKDGYISYRNTDLYALSVILMQAGLCLHNALLKNENKLLLSEINEYKSTEGAYIESLKNNADASNKKYKELINILPEGVIFIKNKKITGLNKTMEKIFEEKEQNLIGRNIYEFIPKEKVKYLEGVLKSLYKEGNDLITCELSLELNDGKSCILEVGIKSIDSIQENTLLVLARDVTEMEKSVELRKQIEENERSMMQMKQYEVLRNEFIANISHELRTPVNVIFSAVQMCEYNFNHNKIVNYEQKLREYIGMIKQNSYRLIRLINNIIDITKIDAGFIKLKMINGNIVSAIEDITQSVSSYIKDKGINIIFDTDCEEKIMAFDPYKIERVMLNLLSNAVKFTPSNGYIYVTFKDLGKNVHISIEDTGSGIPDEKKKIIFDRFIQVDKSLSRNAEGSGIGLSIVKAIVEMHEGCVYVKDGDKKGTKFVIELPVLDAESEEEAITYDEDNHIEKIKVEFSDIYNI